MSTLNSNDLHLSRPSTRVRHAPGGATSINLAFDETPVGGGSKLAHTPPRRTASNPEPPKEPSPMKETPAEPDESAEAATTTPESDATGSGEGIRVGVVYASTVSVVDILKQRTIDELRGTGVTEINTLEVGDVLQLPFAVQNLVSKGSVDAVIAIGILTEEVWAAKELAAAVYSGLVQVSLALQAPVVQGIVFSETERTVLSKAAALPSNWATSAIKSFTSPRTSASAPNGTASAAPVAAPSSRGDVTGLIRQLKEDLATHGAKGVLSLGRKFRIADDDNNGKISFDEFKKVVQEHGLRWGNNEMRAVFNNFDENGDGSIQYDEFLVALRGEMNERRTQIVLTAYAQLDYDKSGSVDYNDVVDRYDATKHPDVVAGRKTRQSALREFLDTFDTIKKDGQVTPDEFIKYYSALSASIDDDDYFELMVRNAWRLSGGDGWTANTANRRVLVTRADGRDAVVELKNDLATAPDTATVMRLLQRQGIEAKDIKYFGSADNTTKGGAARPPGAVETSKSAANPRKERPRGAGPSSIVLG